MKLGTGKVVAIGEAMIEMAPVDQGLYRRGFAGDTFNTAWHMAQLLSGKFPVGFVTRIGRDRVSDQFLAEAVSDGLNVTGISRDVARTMGLYMIELDGVERSFVYWRNASAARALADDRSELAKAIGDAGLIHFSGITLAILSVEARQGLLDLLAAARARGAVISFDPNIRPRLWSSQDEIRASITKALALTDIALPSFDDERSVWGDATPADTVSRYLATGVGEIAVKNGSDDILVHFDGVSRNCATPPVSDILDTTGAGDAFNAGYLSARVTGLDVIASVRAGQAVSAEVIRTLGARAPRERMSAALLTGN